MERKLTIGLALDSGGAMGGAHIGVLDVLKENGIPIDIVVGSSAGAAVGAFYASGTLDAFKEMITDLSFIDALSFYADPVFPVSGLLAGKRARRFLSTFFKDIRIEDLGITYVSVATDLLTGETVPISNGLLADAVMASISMPGIFKPLVLNERLLTDGGVSDPLPLDILQTYTPDITIACNLHSRLPDKISSSQSRAIIQAQEMSGSEDVDLPSWFIDRMLAMLKAEKVLSRVRTLKGYFESIPKAGAVRETDLISALKSQLDQSRDKIFSLIGKSFSSRDKEDMLNIFEVMLNATNIQQYQKNRLMLMYIQPDVLIEPVINHVRALEFYKGEGTIAEGRQKALEAVPKIKALIEEKSSALAAGQAG